MAKQTPSGNDMIIFNYHHLLPATLPKEYSDKFLGRLVPNRRYPKLNYIPDWDVNQEGALSPQQLVLHLSDTAVPYKSLNAILSNTKSYEAEARVTELLGLRASKNTATSTSVEAIRVERNEMGLIQQKIDELMKHKQYSDPVIKYLIGQPDRSCAMVTGIVVCKELTVKHKYTDQKGFGVDVKAPIGAAPVAFGAPPIEQLDTDIKFDRDRKEKEKEESITKEEVVIALAYTQVQLQQVREESAAPAVKHNDGLSGFVKKLARKSPATPMVTTEEHYILKALNLDADNAYMGSVENGEGTTINEDKKETGLDTKDANIEEENTKIPKDPEGNDQIENRETNDATLDLQNDGT